MAASAPAPRVRNPVAPDFLAVRQLADQAFARASGAPLRDGNAITLLKDAEDNYPAWLAAIYHATTSIYLEMYFFKEDEQGRRFADALVRKAREGPLGGLAGRRLARCRAKIAAKAELRIQRAGQRNEHAEQDEWTQLHAVWRPGQLSVG